MNKQSLFFTFIVAIVTLLIALNLISILAKKKNINTTNLRLNTSLSLWYLSILLPFFLLLKVSLEMIENSIEVLIYSATSENTFLAVMEKILVYVGLSFVFSVIVYLITEKLITFSFGKRQDSIEIENNNYSYFIFKLSLATLLVYSLLSVYEHFLRWFLPVVETPFYH
ncbi:hypothetical protein [Flavobacterium cyclinae]|uniref:hypothetical protein n=1 Tax=Flavobacterium cyclinae TaxID=2895947 RepID=UPI001E4B07EF|nr:hypothetical protein [Flavobacterium cyclinae]UGS19878.1 hypothetical protein LOS86_07560 [Flavobacterium cyclinae]